MIINLAIKLTIFYTPAGHFRECGNPATAKPLLDSGSPLRCGRNDEFSYPVNIKGAKIDRMP